MSLFPLSFMTNAAPCPVLGLCLALGLICGAVYFGAVWQSARLFAAGGRAAAATALMIGRIALAGTALYFASRAGALPLLAMASGIWLSRSLVLRCVGSAPA